ncbi:MAG TPA: hemerythrin domain-containing protein [Nocardioidaceae bacterium]|nr:hemerythrin domain-containing protein [Nocardioidaceae bacterium]
MEPSPARPKQAFVEALRRRRSELRESMSALELALASPAPEGQARWTERVHVALVELSADFREHIAITEGSDGLYHELLQTAPRLSGAVARLTREHAVMTRLLDDVLHQVSTPTANQDVDSVRDLGTELLGTLVRHRQRGSDLVYEAFQIDVGGES